MKPDKIIVKKADGTEEFFEKEKLRSSLARAGAVRRVVEKVISKIENELKTDKSEIIETSTIFRKASKILEEDNKPLASKYSLKRALTDMGPSGFPFEYLVEEIFKSEGFKTETGIYLKGQCAEHEIDVIAENKKKFIVAEAKFHNKSGIKSDLKVILYVNSRYKDLIKNNFDGRKKDELKSEGWLVTNTKFTRNSIVYAKCVGLKLLSWNYPEDMSLRYMIEKANMHPISVLSSLTNEEKRKLFDKGIVLSKSLKKNKDFLSKIGIRNKRINEIIEEAEKIISI